MTLDIGKRITEQVLNDVQDSLDYKSRMILAERFAERTNRALADQGVWSIDPAAPPNLAITDIVSDIKNQGYHALGPVLSEIQSDDIKAHFAECDIYNDHFVAKSDGIPRRIGTGVEAMGHGSYRLSDILAAPHIIEIANEKRILDAATHYVGCLPTLFSINVYWSFAGGTFSNNSIHAFHRDLDDFRFCSFFIYLTDCPENDGAHQYIRASHRPDLMQGVLGNIDPNGSIDRDKFFSAKFEGGDADYERLLGDSVDLLPGAAGDGFMTDPWGLHRACPTISGDRMLILIRYGLNRNSTADRHAETAVAWRHVAGRIPKSPESEYINRLILE
jgi:hypothetical protein